MNYRKSIFTAVVFLPLVLVACGSKDEANNASTSSTVQSSTQAKPDDVKSKEEEEAAKKRAEEEEAAKKAQEGEAAAAAAPAPAEGGELPDAAIPIAPTMDGPMNQPVEGGKPANDSDRQDITNLVNGLSGGTLLDTMNYTIDNACGSILESRGGADHMRQAAAVMAVDPQYSAVHQPAPGMTVQDVQVNGDRGSALVLSDTGESDNVQVLRENGKWKLCPNQ